MRTFFKTFTSSELEALTIKQLVEAYNAFAAFLKEEQIKRFSTKGKGQERVWDMQLKALKKFEEQQKTPDVTITRKSSIERPTKAVWDIAEEMTAKDPSVRRKDVIAECVERGIAYYTARTQYQQWLTATRNSK